MTFSTTFKLFSLSLAVLVTGCQTVEEPQSAPVTAAMPRVEITSSAPKVQVWDGNHMIGRSPVTIGESGGSRELLFYKEGSVPQRVRLTPPFGNGFEVMLEPTNTYLYNLLARERVRFVKRSNLGAVMIEPVNQVVEEGYAYTYYDPQKNREATLVVVDIQPAYIKLRSKDGANVYYPLLTL